MQSKPSTPIVILTRWNIIFVSIALFIILFGMTILLSYKYYQDSKVQSLKEDLSSSYLISLVIDQHVQKIVKTMNAFSTRPLLVRAVEERNVEKAKIHLVNLAKSDPDIDILIITDKEGTLWSSYPVRPEITGTNLAHRDWYKGVSKDWKIYVSNMILRIVAEKDAAFQIAVPLFDESGKVVGIMVNTQRAITISKIMKQINLDPGTYVNITDRAGNLVYSSRFAYEKEIVHYPFYLVKEKAISAKNNTVLVKDPYLEGRNRYITYVPIADIGWSIFVGRDSRAILMAGLTYYIQTAMISMLLFILIIGSLVYLRKRELTRQLSEKLESEKKLQLTKEALRDAELKFKTIFDQASDGMILAENESRTFYMANNKVCEMLGYTQKEIIKIGLSEIHLEKDLPYVIEQFERMAKNEISIASDIPVMRKNGSIFYADITSSSVNLGGKDYIIGVFRDITERKQAEDKIRRQSRLLAAINSIFYETLTADSEEAVAKACLGIIQKITDSKFGFIGEITPDGFFSTTALSDPGWETCRISETQATVMIKNMIIRGIWGQVLLKEQSLIVNDPVSYPDRVGIPEGHPPLISFLGVPLKEQGRVVGMIAMANRGTGYTADHQQDMEALSIAFVEAIRRKQAEEKIKQLNNELEKRVIERTVQLETANKELASFAYSISHDLRAPLRGIDGWSLALLEDYKDKIDEEGRQYIDSVRSETQLMGKLIDDLLMFSRQSNNEMNEQRLDMTVMAQAIVSRLQQQNPTLQADFIIQPGLTARGDFSLIEIALKNLLDNALKFSSKGSRAVIEFGQIEQEGGKAFFVRDNGVGFDMAYAHKLFGVFQRLHKSSEFPGTGIGLATVQRIINRHGGRIWVESRLKEGTTFYFILKEAT